MIAGSLDQRRGRAGRVVLGLLVLAGLAGAQSSSGSEAQEPVTPTAEFKAALEAFRSTTVEDQRRQHLLTMITHVGNGLPFVASPTDDQQRRKREDSFAPLLLDPDAMDFVVRVALSPDDDSAALCVGAAKILADRGDAVSAGLLLSAYASARDHPKVLPGMSRQLGRCLRPLRSPEGEPELPVVEQALELLHADLEESGVLHRGAAAEGLFLAGETDIALHEVAELLVRAGGELDHLERVHLFQDLLLRPDLDAGVLGRAGAICTGVIEHVLATQDDSDTQVLARVSPRAQRFDKALQFLCNAERVEYFHLLFRAYRAPAAARLLSIDRLQNLRLTLQALRPELAVETRGQLDEYFLGHLRRAGQRLFVLPEEPMDQEERRRFGGDRDLRYNAASYFCAMWDSQEDVRRLCVEEPDLAEYLTLLARADADLTDDVDSPLFHGVADKVETRILCARMLGMMQEHLGRRVTDIDLLPFFLGQLIHEIRSPEDEVMAGLELLLGAPSKLLMLEVPKVRAPADGWVRSQCLVGLRELGFRVLSGPESYLLGVPERLRASDQPPR